MMLSGRTLSWINAAGSTIRLIGAVFTLTFVGGTLADPPQLVRVPATEKRIGVLIAWKLTGTSTVFATQFPFWTTQTLGDCFTVATRYQSRNCGVSVGGQLTGSEPR